MEFMLIDCRTLSTPAELHSKLKNDLSFPSYYGGNLSALNDCLGDIDQPVCIDLYRPEEAPDWFEGFKKVLDRVALENPMLRVRELQEETDAILLHKVLHLLQDQGLASAQANDASATAAPATVDGRETARNLATGSDGDRFECGACGCRISDLLEESKFLFDGISFCPNCGREISNPGGTEAMKWVSELI